MIKKIIIFILLLSVSFILIASGYAIYKYPDIKKLKDRKNSFKITVYDWNKKPHPFIVGPKNPYYVSWQNISTNVKWAVILSEDAKFYRHHGVDYQAIKEAFKKNIEMGKYVRGGSTITQQLAKNLFLSREKTIIRKIKELIIAFLMEQILSKTRILELYLNVVELGPMVYGVGHASYFYFGKPVSSLSPLEASMLAGLLPGPQIYDPYRNLEKVESRAKKILLNMFNAKIIDEDTYENFKSAKLTFNMENKITLRLEKIEKETFENYSSSFSELEKIGNE